MTTLALIAALAASLLSAPASAHESPALVRNLGTADAAVRLPGGHFIQLEHMPDYLLDQAGLIDCLYFEDGSLKCQ